LAGSLELFGIELLIVDNADNLQREALLDLKQLFDESGVPIVLVGGQETVPDTSFVGARRMRTLFFTVPYNGEASEAR
jgi:DNA transposition AAA+ family ATPase